MTLSEQRPVATVPPMTLARAMHRALTAAGRKVEAATADRNRLIREAIAAGGSTREVGEAVGLSHRAVQLIVQRETDGRRGRRTDKEGGEK